MLTSTLLLCTVNLEIMDTPKSSSAAVTKASKSSHIFTWDIENFCTRFLQLKDSKVAAARTIISPTFEVVHPDGISVTSWNIALEVMNDGGLSVYAHLKACPQKYLKNDGGLVTAFLILFGTRKNTEFYGFPATKAYRKPCGGFSLSTRLGFVGANIFKPVADLLTGDVLRIHLDLTIFAPAQSSLSSAKDKSDYTITVEPQMLQVTPTVAVNSNVLGEDGTDELNGATKQETISTSVPTKAAEIRQAGRSRNLSSLMISDLNRGVDFFCKRFIAECIRWLVALLIICFFILVITKLL